MKKPIVILSAQCYSNARLAAKYRMDVKTFKKNIKALLPTLGKKVGNKWSINQLQIILNHMDEPYLVVPIKDVVSSIKLSDDPK